MRFLSMVLLAGAMAIISNAQSPAESQNPSDVVVLKSSWTKDLIGWQGDPFSGPIENFDEMRARARNEKRIEDAKRSRSPEVDKIKQEARVDQANIEKVRQKSRPRYAFIYKATVKNTSPKTIKAIDWDYIFFDREGLSEIGRQQFTSEEKIGPGKTRELTILIGKPPTHTISVTALNKNEREGLSEQVTIVRIEYTDGSVWQRP